MPTDDLKFRIGAIDDTKRAFNSVRSSITGLKGAFAGIGISLSAGALVSFVKSTAEANDEINKLSTQIGASTEALSQYKFVAQQTGVEFNTLTTGWQRMTRRISEASFGTGEAADALKELGLSAQRLALLRPEEQFEEIADALNGVQSSSRRVALAMKIFDTEGVRLLRTAEGGAAAIREMREEADELGYTLDQQTADSMTAFVDEIGRMKGAAVGLGQSIARELLPHFLEFSRAVVDGWKELARWVDTLKDADLTGINQQIIETETNILKLQKRLRLIQDKKGKRGYSRAEEKKVLAGIAKLEAELVELEKEKIALTNERRAVEEQAAATAEKAREARAAEIEGVKQEYEAKKRAIAISKEKLRLDQETARILQYIKTPLDEHLDLLETLDELLDKGRIGWKEYQQAILKSRDALDDLNEKGEETKDEFADLKLAIEGWARDVTDSFVDMTGDIGDAFEDLAKIIAKSLFTKHVSEPIVKAAGGFFDDIIGSIFSRAGGGPVYGGAPTVVGERGPELFFPPAGGGEIVAGGAGAVTINFQINSLDPRTAADVIVENRNTIVGVVRGAFERAGSSPRLA